MRKNKRAIIVAIIIISVLVIFIRARHKPGSTFALKEMSPITGDLRISVVTTGVVKPQNRLEIKPSISGRLEEILVKEGDKVKKGQILAYMSSTERAALIDAARFKDPETLKYWEEVYKQTPIISPIDGEVIVRSVEPGQAAASSDSVLVLSDRLIVSAQFDETDIARLQKGQAAIITLDAYPSVKIQGAVDHIAFESELISNVNIYNVDVLPQEIPDFFRSGMSANVEVIEKERRSVLLVPVEAMIEEQGKTFVMVKKNALRAKEKRAVQAGLSDEKNIEIISGLSADDIIFVPEQSYLLQKKQAGSNPFMPSRAGTERRR